MEDDAAELVVAGVEGLLLVLLPEEARVGEARAHHAIGALRDEVGAVRGVDDGEVARRELVLPRLDAEVALVPAGDGADDGRRQREERAVEGAGDDVGLLDERRVLVDEHRLGVVRAPGGARGGVDALHHRGDALLAVDEHVTLAELLDVRGGALHVEVCRREEPVAARGARRLRARERQRDHLVAEQRDQPLHRAPERRVPVGPPHRLAEGDGRAHALERPREQLHRRPPCLHAPPDDVAPGLLLRACLLLDDDERIDARPELRGEGLARLGRLAVLEGHRLRRSDDLLVEIELPGGDALHHDREAPRRAQRAHVPVREPHLRELVGDDLRQGGERDVDEGGGKLLRADLEEQGQRSRHGSRGLA